MPTIVYVPSHWCHHDPTIPYALHSDDVNMISLLMQTSKVAQRHGYTNACVHAGEEAGTSKHPQVAQVQVRTSTRAHPHCTSMHPTPMHTHPSTTSTHAGTHIHRHAWH